MKKILIIVEDYTKFGGVEKVTANMSSMFVNNDFPIWGVLSLHKENDISLIDYNKNLNIEVVKRQNVTNFIESKGITDVILQIGSLKEASCIVNKLYGKVAIISILHSTPYAYTKYILEKSTWKDWLSFFKKELLVRFINIFFFKNIIKKSKFFLTVSKKGVKELEDILNNSYKNVDYIYNLIPNVYTSLKKFGEKENIILYGGRLDKNKRVFETVKYLSSLLKKRAAWEYYILGDGDEYEEIQEYITNNSIENIKLIGFKKNIYEYLSKSKICLLYSLYEGLPTILVEAGMYKNVLISYNSTSGVSDIILNNENGFIVNNEKELIEKIELLMDNEDLLNRMAESNYINENFHCDKILDKWKKILDL
ncbi:glycosyltransferase [Mannheimia bovis]|uniref:Glycosyltransferase n=1 Tax=Mannheimia bovis TaxID=2770636 RepID=A0A7H1C347_9PAST|nr:glycosyltransferase [Mannheimia bovis]QNS15402.1 glycosyltransferase [Mannheimia bovis]